MTAKLLEKSPIKYSLTRAVSCLVPSTLLNDHAVSESRMSAVIDILYETNNITAVVADKAKGQFSALAVAAKSDLNTKFKNFCRQTDRLDNFYYDVLGNNTEASELFSVVKMILILSHGNATVESGFSVNGSILVENLHEQSVVAQRLAYDSVTAAGGITSVNIDKSMMNYVRSSRGRYMDELKRKRDEQSAEDRKRQERKRAAEAI